MKHEAAPSLNPDAVCLHLSQQLNRPQPHIEQAYHLLAQGRTIPFIARYRKEATGGLDEQQLRRIEDAVSDAKKLEDRRAAACCNP